MAVGSRALVDDHATASSRPRRPRRGGFLRRHIWLIAFLVAALGIGELPRLLSTCCAPAGDTGFGTAWFVSDFAQYESAMRQGGEQPGWLIRDPFTAEPHSTAFIFPLYVGIGKLAATLSLPPTLVEQIVEVLARALLVFALWRFCRAFARGKEAARWAFGLALFASGFELFALLVRGGYQGGWSYEMNGLGLLFAAPHVPLAMAATLELARDLLRPTKKSGGWWLLKVAALSAAISLLQPFHLPILLAAAVCAALSFWLTRHSLSNLIGALVAIGAALPVLALNLTTFSLDPFWATTYSLQNLLPSPAPHELLVDLGLTLVLALLGAYALRGRVAPFGLVLWLLLALVAMYLPVPYQRRLSFGVLPMLSVLAANTLMAACVRLGPRRAVGLRLATLAVAASSTALVLVGVLDSGIHNTPLPVYRSTTDLDAAAAWLNTQATSDDVIMADWDASNYLAARTPAREYGGHAVATLHPAQKRFAIATVFAHPSSLIVARQLGAQWLVYGPEEAGIPSPPDPAFQSGAVKVYRIG
ncbi:MAG: hypothetical protein JO057_20450 [Chloroflexi bacterium]|nr:hypothetical protein [Chloroflexota bacterium]